MTRVWTTDDFPWQEFKALISESPNHFIGHELAHHQCSTGMVLESWFHAMTSHLTWAGRAQVNDGRRLSMAMWGLLGMSPEARGWLLDAMTEQEIRDMRREG